MDVVRDVHTKIPSHSGEEKPRFEYRRMEIQRSRSMGGRGLTDKGEVNGARY